MKAIAKQILDTLKSSTDVTDLVGPRIYWGLGKQKENEAAIIFSVQEQNNGASADSRSWATTIRVYAEDMDQASDVYEAVRSVMTGEGYFQSGSSGISDDESKEAVMEITYNLK
jgi:phage-related protein